VSYARLVLDVGDAEHPHRLHEQVALLVVEGRATEAIACLGGSALDNEEAYLLAKLMRALGLVYLEHQARL